MLFSTIVFVLLNIILKSVPGIKDEALGAVFSVLAYLVVFQHDQLFVMHGSILHIFYFALLTIYFEYMSSNSPLRKNP